MYNTFSAAALLCVVMVFLALQASFAQNDAALPLAVHLKVDKKYHVNVWKVGSADGARQLANGAKPDSIKQTLYDVTLTIKNTAANPVHIWMMTCSWYDNLIINNYYIDIVGWGCDKNAPVPVTFAPAESRVYKLTLKKSFNNPYDCINCFGNSLRVMSTKIGLVVIDDVFKKHTTIADYDTCIADKSRWKTAWSNALYLLGK
jgi:hypothetical protein